MSSTTGVQLPADWNTATQHYSYSEFRQMLDALHAEGKVTGQLQDEHLLAYSKLNDVRMNRIEKHGSLSAALVEQLSSLTKPITILVITEGWCGDSAQLLPFIQKLADTQPLIHLSIILRDENPQWMDRYLTNGSRSIPMAVVFNSEGKYITHWGPRPKVIADAISQWKNEGMPMDKIKEQLHLLYAKDKGNAFCEEWVQLINGCL